MLIAAVLAFLDVSDPDCEINLFESVESDRMASSWEMKRVRAKALTLKSMQHANGRTKRKFILKTVYTCM